MFTTRTSQTAITQTRKNPSIKVRYIFLFFDIFGRGYCRFSRTLNKLPVFATMLIRIFYLNLFERSKSFFSGIALDGPSSKTLQDSFNNFKAAALGLRRTKMCPTKSGRTTGRGRTKTTLSTTAKEVTIWPKGRSDQAGRFGKYWSKEKNLVTI